MLFINFKEAFNIEIHDEKYLKYKNDLDTFFDDKTMSFKYKNYNFVDINHFDFYIAYCFEKIRHWIYKHETYDEKYIDNLEKIIAKLNLSNKLGSYEIMYLNHFKEVIFAKTRNLKKLIVDFPLETYYTKKNNLKVLSELVCFQFINSCLYEIKNNKQEMVNDKSEMYLSDKRIIFNNTSNVVSIYFSDIYEYSLEKNGLRILIKYFRNNQLFENEYLLTTYDNFVLYVAFQRLINIWLKKFNKNNYKLLFKQE